MDLGQSYVGKKFVWWWVVVGGWCWVVEGKFSVTLWSKPKVKDLDLDQAEQFVLMLCFNVHLDTRF